MEWHEITGFVAGFGTTFAAAPDFLAMLKRRSSQGHESNRGRHHGAPFKSCGYITVS